ncbi:MAG TPA: ABC transporter substrate-binding protein [Stellaceae bacterium]|nr:ABC transporter substrate-binding protein [Stellaceae bacterium]
MNRRELISAGLALPFAAGVGVSARAAAQKVKVVIPENSVFVLSWQGARDAGVFTKHGIDLEVDVRPFAGYLAGLPSKECLATTYAGLEAIAKINQGVDWAIIGGGLTVFQEVFVRTDSPIQKIEELRGKKFGTFSTASGALKATRAALIDAYGFDLAKETKLVQLAPPALFKLVENGSIDAMVNISSFTVDAASQPQKFRAIFSPNDYWKKKTGYPIVWSAPLVAWRSWVEQDVPRARAFAAAAEESFLRLRDPGYFDVAVKKYGTLAGIKGPAAIATYKKWLGEKRLFLAEWTKKAVGAQWQFLEMAKANGVLDKVPEEKKYAQLVQPDGKEKPE